jgi:hypothetical protein
VTWFWGLYYLWSDDAFEDDYLAATNENGNNDPGKKPLLVFFQTQRREMRIRNGWNDEKVMRLLRLYFRLFQQRNILATLFSLKSLSHIAVVQVSKYHFL